MIDKSDNFCIVSFMVSWFYYLKKIITINGKCKYKITRN